MKKPILITAAIMGVLAILLGAFGAHGLKSLISADAIQTFEVGIRYQMYHALFLLFIGSSKLVTLKYKNLIFYLVVFGILFFSGSIYGLATNNLSSFNFKSIAFITPIGGLLLIVSWVLLIINFVKLKD